MTKDQTQKIIIAMLTTLLVVVSGALAIKTFRPQPQPTPATKTDNIIANEPAVPTPASIVASEDLAGCTQDIDPAKIGLDGLKPKIDTELGVVVFDGVDFMRCRFDFWLAKINGKESNYAITQKKDQSYWSLAIPIRQFQDGANTATFSYARRDQKETAVDVSFSIVMPKPVNLDVKWLPAPIVDTSLTVSANANQLVPSPDDAGPTSDIVYSRIGTIESGRYAGDLLYQLMLPSYFEGPSFYSATGIAIADKKNSRLVIVSDHSDILPLPENLSAVSAIDGLSYIQDLQLPPGELKLAKGYGLARIGYPDFLPDSGEHKKIGQTNDSRTIYESRNKAPSIRMKNGELIEYKLTMPFYDESKRLPQITWKDGTANDADYYPVTVGGCGPSDYLNTVDEDAVSGKLVAIGKTSNSENIFGLKDPNDAIIKKMYDGLYSYGGEKPAYAEYVAKRPAIFWKSPFGQWVQWRRGDSINLGECGKPVVYLYPTKTEQVSVKLGKNIEVSKSEPAYGDGWTVTAEPNGTLTTSDGQTYPNLFWEGNGASYQTPKSGFVIASRNLPVILREKLIQLGLNDQEAKDFGDFWVPKLTASPYALVSFVPQAEWAKAAPLRIVPTPQTLIRVFMDWKPLAEPIDVPEQVLPPPPARNGFTAVEWGGLLY